MNRLLTEEHYEKSYAKAPAFSGQMEDFIMWEFMFMTYVRSRRLAQLNVGAERPANLEVGNAAQRTAHELLQTNWDDGDNELFQCLVESMRNCREGQNLAFLTETETATVPNIPIGTKSQRLMRAIRARFYNMEETGRQLDKFRVKLLTLRIMQGASVSRFLDEMLIHIQNIESAGGILTDLQKKNSLENCLMNGEPALIPLSVNMQQNLLLTFDAACASARTWDSTSYGMLRINPKQRKICFYVSLDYSQRSSVNMVGQEDSSNFPFDSQFGMPSWMEQANRPSVSSVIARDMICDNPLCGKRGHDSRTCYQLHPELRPIRKNSNQKSGKPYKGKKPFDPKKQWNKGTGQPNKPPNSQPPSAFTYPTGPKSKIKPPPSLSNFKGHVSMITDKPPDLTSECDVPSYLITNRSRIGGDVMSVSKSENDDLTIVDSAVSSQLIIMRTKEFVSNAVVTNSKLGTANSGGTLEATHVGHIAGFKTYVCPGARANLMSSRIFNKVGKVFCHDDTPTIRDSTHRIIYALGHHVEDMPAFSTSELIACLDSEGRPSTTVAPKARSAHEEHAQSILGLEALQLYHRRLNHMDPKKIVEAVRKQLLPGITLQRALFSPTNSRTDKCPCCIKSKMHRVQFPPRSELNPPPTRMFETIVADVLPFNNLPSRQGYEAVLHLTCVASRSIWITMLKSRAEVAAALVKWANTVYRTRENQSLRWEHFHSDQEGQLMTAGMKNFLASIGVHKTSSPADTPELNGIAESTSKILNAGTRTLIIGSGLSSDWWADAMQYFVKVREGIPTRTAQGYMSPYEFQFHKLKDMSRMRVWGCRAWVALTRQKIDQKWDPRSEEGIFIGLSEDPTGYIIYVPARHIEVVSVNVVFDEDVPPRSESYYEGIDKDIPLTDDVPRDVESFKYLVDTVHRDPEDQLLYRVTKVGTYHGDIVGWRVLELAVGKSRRKTEMIHIADLVQMTDATVSWVCEDRSFHQSKELIMALTRVQSAKLPPSPSRCLSPTVFTAPTWSTVPISPPSSPTKRKAQELARGPLPDESTWRPYSILNEADQRWDDTDPTVYNAPSWFQMQNNPHLQKPSGPLPQPSVSSVPTHDSIDSHASLVDQVFEEWKSKFKFDDDVIMSVVHGYSSQSNEDIISSRPLVRAELIQLNRLKDTHVDAMFGEAEFRIRSYWQQYESDADPSQAMAVSSYPRTESTDVIETTATDKWVATQYSGTDFARDKSDMHSGSVSNCVSRVESSMRADVKSTSTPDCTQASTYEPKSHDDARGSRFAVMQNIDSGKIPYFNRCTYSNKNISDSNTIGADLSKIERAMMIASLEDVDYKTPQNRKEMLESCSRDDFIEAEKKELQSLLDQRVLDTYGPIPTGATTIGNRFVYKYKAPMPAVQSPSGKQNRRKRRNSPPKEDLDKYKPIAKARLVLQDTKAAGRTVGDVFAPTGKHLIFRLMMILALWMGMCVDHIDFVTAFLNSPIDTVIYTYATPGSERKPGYGHKLLKSLYGYRRAPRNWHIMLRGILFGIGLSQHPLDHCFFHGIFQNCYIFAFIFVDDVLLACVDQNIINQVKDIIRQKYKITDLGPAKRFLGIHIEYTKFKSVFLHQRDYATALITKYANWCDIFNGVHIKTPLPINYQELVHNPWRPDAHKDAESWHWYTTFPYFSIIGSLLYLSLNTRPVLAHAVNYLSRYSQKPSYGACRCVAHVVSYLSHRTDKGITYYYSLDLDLFGMVDANHANDIETRRSIAGFILAMLGGPYAWGSKLMSELAMSSMQSEYQAYFYINIEIKFLLNFLKVLKIAMGLEGLKVPVFTDSQSAMQTANNPVFHSRTKFFELKWHHTRDATDEIKGWIKLIKIWTEYMIANGFTKQESLAMFRFTEAVLEGGTPITSAFYQLAASQRVRPASPTFQTILDEGIRHANLNTI